MIPKQIKQTTSYNELLIPSEDRRTAQAAQRDIWNEIMRINSAYPKAQIIVENFLKDLGKGIYSFDVKLKCNNPLVQAELDKAYERHMYLPRFKRPEEL